MEINYYQEQIASQMNLNLSDNELLEDAIVKIMYLAFNVKMSTTDEKQKEMFKYAIMGIAEYCTVKGWWLEDILND